MSYSKNLEISKVGRPTEMKSHRRGTNFSVYFDEYQITDIDDIRWRERKSRSEIVRLAVDEYIKTHKEGNNAFTLEKWADNPNFQAVPALLSPAETWKNFLLNHTSKDEVTKISLQCSKIKEFVKIKMDRLKDVEDKEKQELTKQRKTSITW